MDKIELKIQEISKGVSYKGLFILILRETDGNRKLPILLNSTDARSILALLHPNPWKHTPLTEALQQMTTAFGIILDEGVITDVDGGLYRAHVTFVKDGQTEEIKIRAIDFILLAILYRCPIYIKTSLFESQYIHFDRDSSFSIPINTLNVELLKEALEIAVKDENYELASQLRDEIKRRT